MKKRMFSVLALLLSVLLFAASAAPGFAEGGAPVAENLELTTYRNVSVGGSLSGFDPEGDALSFEITTQPVKGSIQLKADGSFIYTPDEGKKGRDYFGYKATVIIRIEKQKKDVFYADMAGRGDEYAAVALSEYGIFTGEQLGGVYCFHPEETVTRGEFISMCMLVSGEPVFGNVLSTGYADDGDIPAWMKGYVVTAALCGIDYGRSDEAGGVFDADAAISRAEAARILDRVMGVAQVSYLQPDEELEPALAQACVNLSAHGMLQGTAGMDNSLKRSEAAQMLSAALTLRESRVK